MPNTNVDKCCSKKINLELCFSLFVPLSYPPPTLSDSDSGTEFLESLQLQKLQMGKAPVSLSYESCCEMPLEKLKGLCKILLTKKNTLVEETLDMNLD